MTTLATNSAKETSLQGSFKSAVSPSDGIIVVPVPVPVPVPRIRPWFPRRRW